MASKKSGRALGTTAVVTLVPQPGGRDFSVTRRTNAGTQYLKACGNSMQWSSRLSGACSFTLKDLASRLCRHLGIRAPGDISAECIEEMAKRV